MIGHFLLTLGPLQEDAVLTSHMYPLTGAGGPCLLMTVSQVSAERLTGMVLWYSPAAADMGLIGPRFDSLCLRFGWARVNAAIRNRILSNRARRALQGVSETVTTESIR